MEEIKTVLKNLIDAAPSKNKIFKRNILKEYLQILVLDYIYLMWYLQKGVRPNIGCIEGAVNLDELKEKLSEAVKKADARSIQTDLEALVDDKNKVLRLSDNMNDILIREIEKMK